MAVRVTGGANTKLVSFASIFCLNTAQQLRDGQPEELRSTTCQVTF